MKSFFLVTFLLIGAVILWAFNPKSLKQDLDEETEKLFGSEPT